MTTYFKFRAMDEKGRSSVAGEARTSPYVTVRAFVAPGPNLTYQFAGILTMRSQEWLDFIELVLDRSNLLAGNVVCSGVFIDPTTSEIIPAALNPKKEGK